MLKGGNGHKTYTLTLQVCRSVAKLYKSEVSSIVFDKLRRENFTNFSRMTAVNHCFTPSSGDIQGPTKRL